MPQEGHVTQLVQTYHTRPLSSACDTTHNIYMWACDLLALYSQHIKSITLYIICLRLRLHVDFFF